MFPTSSLLPLAEKSDFPHADPVAHSTATQAQQGTICAGKQIPNERQNNSFLSDCISQFPDLPHQAVRGRDGNTPV